MKCLFGYAGGILRVDLTKGRIRIERLPKDMILTSIGGKGFGSKLLFEENVPGIDPYHPESNLVLATGPVNGAILSGASRLCAVFKSPLTGLWGESQCGGYFAPQMKFAGFDVIVVKGKAVNPKYLLIEDGSISIIDAFHLWGKDTYETEKIIQADHGRDLAVLSIGPAGENLVRFACITHNRGRQFGRCGSGALLGSKRLKAIAVVGHEKIKIAEPEGFDDFKVELRSQIRERLNSLTKYGTGGIMALTNTTGTLPTRNWTEGEFEGFEKISAETMRRNLFKRSKSCFACAVACGKISRIDEGPHNGTLVEGPEYETVFAFGSLCGNDDVQSIVKANDMCDRLGMDTISAGNALAFAMECCEKGIIKAGQLEEESPLGFGNHQGMLTTLRRIAYREGLGDILAEGVRKASEKIGRNSKRFAVHVKGLEPPGYDPRGLKGVALAYAVSCRGACHLRHMAHRPNLTGSHPFTAGSIDRLSYAGQARVVLEQSYFYTLVDSMVLCKFLCLPTIGPILWEKLTRLHSIITGMRIEMMDFIEIAKRVNNLVRSFNMREGMTSKADTLPQRFLNERLKNGASKGELVKTEALQKMLQEYTNLHNT